MTVRVRFAPSPTGKVHIGNIRAAIFNWLFARHEKGKFLLRIEDTDLERSTPEAIQALYDVMSWLHLDYDEEVMYQTTQCEKHLQAAQSLYEKKLAYYDAKGGDKQALIFRFPYDADQWVPGCRCVGEATLDIISEEPVIINKTGISWAVRTRTGKVARENCTLAGMKSLQLINQCDDSLFDLDDHMDQIIDDNVEFSITMAVKLKFIRRTITYTDLVKGELTKPLDSLKDFVIVRSDGSPVFHIGNVVDDISQSITHIIRGDDHVENTFKHIFIFAALGEQPPQYGHLPMIVNAQGKPYSKRDGDAFVGDFRDKGFLADAFFNYLSLLGWAPGDDREKLSRDELIEAFTLQRVRSAPAQMDLRKMENLNGLYIAEIPLPQFTQLAQQEIEKYPWWNNNLDLLANVAELMQVRTHKFMDIATWQYFFTMPEYNETVVDKVLRKQAAVYPALQELAKVFPTIAWNEDTLDETIKAVAEKHEAPVNKLNPALRFAITGTNAGACLFRTLCLLSPEDAAQRIGNALERFPAL